MATHDIEIVLFNQYMELETIACELRLLSHEAYRDFLRTRNREDSEKHRVIADHLAEVRDQAETAHREWSLACKVLHDFPLSDEERELISETEVA